MIEIKEANKKQISRIRRLYKTAFPVAERKQWVKIEKQLGGCTEVLSIMEDGEFRGLIINMLNDDIVLLDYFAVDEKYRGNGIGTKVLKAFRERYKGKRMELEIEVPEENAPNNAQRLSRKDFYLRNGLKETGLAHINPDGVKLALLAFDEPITHDEYMDTMRKSYGKKMAAKFIEIK